MAYVGGGLGGSDVSAGGSWSVTNPTISMADYAQKKLNGQFTGSYSDYVAQMTAMQNKANTINLPTINGGISPPANPGVSTQPVTTSTPTTTTGTTTSTGGADLQQIADPFASQRSQYQNQLSQLMANPSSIANTGAYQWAFNQGQNALERSQAAKGMNLSGNALAQLSDYGQGQASQQFNQYANLLSGLSGAAPGSPAAAASSIASVSNNANDNAMKNNLLNSQNYWAGLNYARGTGQTPNINYSLY